MIYVRVICCNYEMVYFYMFLNGLFIIIYAKCPEDEHNIVNGH